MPVEQYRTANQAAEPDEVGESDAPSESDDWCEQIEPVELDMEPPLAARSAQLEPPEPSQRPRIDAVVVPPSRRWRTRLSTWAKGTDAELRTGAPTPVPMTIQDASRTAHRTTSTLELDVNDIEIEATVRPVRRDPTLEVAPLPPPIPTRQYPPGSIARPWADRLTPRPSRRRRIVTRTLGTVAAVAIGVLLWRSPSPAPIGTPATPPQPAAAIAPAPAPVSAVTAAAKPATPAVAAPAPRASTTPAASKAAAKPATLHTQTTKRPAAKPTAATRATTKSMAAAVKPTSARPAATKPVTAKPASKSGVTPRSSSGNGGAIKSKSGKSTGSIDPAIPQS